MPKRRLLKQVKKVTLSNTTAEYVTFDVIEPGWVLYITTGSIEDSTSAPTTLSFGFLYAGEYYAAEEQDTVSAGIAYNIDKTHHFIPGEQPAYRVEGGTSGDIIKTFVEGYYIKTEDVG